ncbi:hypothetical protein [Proteus mirabilis]|uniref:hypothetical protein n=1 Tax=Proteus mirabilis TaxID=584 RepID=UPI001A1F7474|nr:hypothetical protein [Proteus mirabilis]MBI6281885.1 hypothetical protein [Proteus mirabilis]MDF7209203.1 hypothetical protein [Proteus mirabilis]MDM3597692.1 hypothetical protein [Proteus mirabilis]
MTEWITPEENLKKICEAFDLGYKITLRTNCKYNNQSDTLFTDLLTCESSRKGIFFITINDEYYSSYYPEEQRWLKLPKLIFNNLPVSEKAIYSYGISHEELFISSIKVNTPF